MHGSMWKGVRNVAFCVTDSVGKGFETLHSVCVLKFAAVSACIAASEVLTCFTKILFHCM